MKKNFKLILSLFLLISFSQNTKAQNISTLSSGMSMPFGMAAAGGFVYLADFTGNAVYKIDISTGVKTMIAGTGGFGYNGDGIAATTAQLANPGAVAVDASGNIYIADFANVRIRKITVATGLISTVVGNGVLELASDGVDATSTGMGEPFSVNIDASGNLYISDFDFHVIYKVNASDNKINRIAGNGFMGYSGDGGQATLAELFNPISSYLDGNGNIFIAEYSNHVIRKVNLSTGIITTAAGTGITDFSGDGGAATSAGLAGPRGVAVDGAGNLFIADGDNLRVRKVTASTGIITTFAGNGSAPNSGDGGAATAAAVSTTCGVFLHGGNLYITDNQGTLRRVNNSYTILPVEFISFDAKKNAGAVLLEWQTANEKNNSHFIIQHSSDNRNWLNIGQLNANASNKYSFMHTAVKTQNYYRLQQVDIDGRTSYSKVRNVSFQNNSTISAYPNPTSGTGFTIKRNSSDIALFYQLVDMKGSVVQKGMMNGTEQHISTSKLLKGTYALQFSSGERIMITKD